MSVKSHFKLMAEYNQWMNRNIVETCATLNPRDMAEDRGAFFGSIIGTLNHTLVGDTIWLKRFAEHLVSCPSLNAMHELPWPEALDAVLYPDLDGYKNARKGLDAVIIDFIDEVADDALESTLAYVNFKGVPTRKPLGLVLLHFFNHQTHHRGQITTLLSQAGIDAGITDLLVRIPDR